MDSRDVSGVEVDLIAAPPVREAIASMGRTEDVGLAPSGRRVAVAGYSRNRVYVYDVDVARSGGTARVEITGGAVLASAALHDPHGVEFVDDHTLIVANRSGDLCVLAVPEGTADMETHHESPIRVVPASDPRFPSTPGNVALVDRDGERCEVLVCDTFADTVARLSLDPTDEFAVRRAEPLLETGLDTPDGVRLTPDGRWLAVSNHGLGNVLLYDWETVTPQAPPLGMLRAAFTPHGLRFVAGGRVLLVADGEIPFVHLYVGDEDGGWSGVRAPTVSIRVMDDAVWERFRHGPGEGGPKGVDVVADAGVMVVSCEARPLAFFDVSAVVDAAVRGGAIEVSADSLAETRAREMRYEQYVLAAARQRPQWAIARLHRSMSWRVTAPLRAGRERVRQVTRVVRGR